MVRVRKLIVSAATAAAYILASASTARGASELTFTSVLGQSATLVVDDAGVQYITVANADESIDLTLTVRGYGNADAVNLSVDADGSVSAVFAANDGGMLSLLLYLLPEASAVSVNRIDAATAAVAISDSSGERLSVDITLTEMASTASVSITYDELPEPFEPGRVTPLFPGLDNENALGGGITIAAAGLSAESAVVLSFGYNAGDLAGIDESDIRVHRFTNATGAYEPVGENDRGLGAPSLALGDFGVDPTTHVAWTVVDRLGSFAIGVTDDTLGSGVVDDDVSPVGPGRGTLGAICGATGMISLLLTFITLAGLRGAHRGR